MPCLKTGATLYHAQLGLPDKDLVACWMLLVCLDKKEEIVSSYSKNVQEPLMYKAINKKLTFYRYNRRVIISLADICRVLFMRGKNDKLNFSFLLQDKYYFIHF